MQYIIRTKTLRIADDGMIARVDSNYMSSLDCRRSESSDEVMLGRAVSSSFSRARETATASSTENAAPFDTAKDVLFLRLTMFVRSLVEEYAVYTMKDNQGALKMVHKC